MAPKKVAGAVVIIGCRIRKKDVRVAHVQVNVIFRPKGKADRYYIAITIWDARGAKGRIANRRFIISVSGPQCEFSVWRRVDKSGRVAENVLVSLGLN